MDVNDQYWAYLLRVGADFGVYGGGFHGPIFEDGSFDFIPIPEYEEANEFRKTAYGQFTYKNTTSRRIGHVFLDYIQQENVRRRLENKCLHIDPDFANATYGDITKVRDGHLLKSVTKAAALRYLVPGNLLVFCSSLDPFKTGKHDRALYIIGYFEVSNVYDFESMEKGERWNTCQRFREKNSHCSCAHSDQMNIDVFKHLILIEGIRNKSFLLHRAAQLTDERYKVLPQLANDLGLKQTAFLRGGRWLPQKHRENISMRKAYIASLRQILKEHGEHNYKLRKV